MRWETGLKASIIIREAIAKIRRYGITCALLSVILASSAHGSSDAKEIITPTERLWLTENQSRIVLAVETGYAPFLFLDSKDQPNGLAHDYMLLLESKLGFRFRQRRFASLDDIFSKVRSGEVHVVNAVTKTPWRSEFLSFTESFITVPNVIVVRKERLGQMREGDLSGLKVSLVKSYAVTEQLIKKGLGFVPDLVPDDLTGLFNVSFGRSDAAVIDLATASYLIAQKGITNLRVAGEVALNIQLSMGVPHAEPILLSIIQKGLRAITETERREIRTRWINASSQSIFNDRRVWLVIASVVIIIFAVIGTIVVWNRMLRRQVALRTEDLAKEKESLQKIEAILQEQNEELQVNEEELRGQNDHLLATEEMLRVQIDEYETAQKLLRESDEKHRKLENEQQVILNTSSVGIVFTKNRKVVWANPAHCKMFGYDVGETQNMDTAVYYVDSESYKYFGEKAYPIIASGVTFSEELMMKKKDGSMIWCNLVGQAINPQNLEEGSIWSIIDITERKQVEAYKEMSREVLEILNRQGNMQEIIPLVIAALKTCTGFDAVGIRLQAGDDFPYLAQEGFPHDFLEKENLLLKRTLDGRVCRNVDGKNCLECTCGLVISEKTDPANPLFTRGGSFWTNDSFPILDIPPDEDARLSPRNECIHEEYASFALVPIRYKDRTVGLIQFNDRRKGRFTLNMIEIIEGIASNIGATLLRKQLAEEKAKLVHQFHQAQKLESLGVLAGGIAHDFNNILTVIMGHCYMAQNDMIPEQEYKAAFQKMETAGNRAKDLCRQMLTYAGKSPMEQSLVNLWLLVDEVVKMLQAAIKKNVVIELDLKRDVPEINGDTGQIQQIVMNLIINAADAIGEANGTIRVALSQIAFDADTTDADIFGTVIQAGRYVRLEVTDSGCGMDEETQKRIFEPFFTTKFTGRGLGMSAIHGIIKSHEAILQLTSKPGVGTTFKVFFPIPQHSDYAKTTSTATVPLEEASGTILMVEDEDILRVMGKELLEAHGFTAMTASNGSEALEIYRKNGSEIDVILLDLIMPMMGGIEAYHELRKINPTVPIIICSGYGSESVEHVIKNDPHAGFVHKPYKPDELRGVLMRMMKS